MEKRNFTEIIRNVCAQFNPVLDITPIQFRRFNVTMVFSGQVVPKEEINSFITIFSMLLGCSEDVMKNYYNRWNAFHEMDKALNLIQQTFYSKELTDSIEEGIKLLEKFQGMQSHQLPIQQSENIQRPVRKLLNDDDWLQYLCEFTDWEKFAHSKQRVCKRQVKIYKRKIKQRMKAENKLKETNSSQTDTGINYF
jgi:hypothetical protein